MPGQVMDPGSGVGVLAGAQAGRLECCSGEWEALLLERFPSRWVSFSTPEPGPCPLQMHLVRLAQVVRSGSLRKELEISGME